MSPEEVVRKHFAAYVGQDRAAAEALLADGLTFTSSQDDHIDRQAYLERCFPTAERVSRQDLIHVTAANDRDVFVMYEYDLTSGGTHRNAELITGLTRRSSRSRSSSVALWSSRRRIGQRDHFGPVEV